MILNSYTRKVLNKTIALSRYRATVLLLVVGLFLPVFDAQALNPFSLGDIAYSAAQNIFAYSAYIMFSAVGTFMGVAAQMLHWAVNLRIYTNIPVIESSWKIMRDFANMLFIIALIVMAYGTIFNIKGYDFKSLIPRFIIIAVLINFSLVISGLIIDATQVLNNTFLNAMGDISGQLGQGLEPWKLLPKTAEVKEGGEAFVSLISGSFITIIFAVFLAFVFLISVSVPLVVAFVRIPILWALIIISPLAWLLSILPATKGAYDKWWHQFLGWNLFLPYYLFFMYFALYFLSKKDEVIAGLGQTFVDDKVTGLTGLQSDFTFGLIFYYILIAIFLIGGTKVAMSAGTFSGTGIVNVAQWGRDKVANRVGWTAAGRAIKSRYEEAKEKEEARVSRQTAFMREGLGYVTGGRRGLVEEQQAKDIAEAKKKFDRVADSGQLRGLMNKGPLRDRLAVREVMRGRGLLKAGQVIDGKLVGDEYKEMIEMYGGNKTIAGRQLEASIDYSKMNPEQRKAWLESVVDVITKKKIVEAMAEKGDRYLTNEAAGASQNLNKALTYYALEGEQRDLLKKIEKYNLELATQIGLQNQILRKAGELIPDTKEGFRLAMEEAVRKMNPDALLEATKTLVKFAGHGVTAEELEANPELKARRDMVVSSLNLQKIEAMMAKGTQEQLAFWKDIDGRFNEDFIKAEKERKARELAEVTGRATGEALARAGGAGGLGGGGQGGGGTPPAGGAQPPQGQPPATPSPRRPAGFVRPGERVQEGNVVNLRDRKN